MSSRLHTISPFFLPFLSNSTHSLALNPALFSRCILVYTFQVVVARNSLTLLLNVPSSLVVLFLEFFCYNPSALFQLFPNWRLPVASTTESNSLYVAVQGFWTSVSRNQVFCSKKFWKSTHFSALTFCKLFLFAHWSWHHQTFEPQDL